MPNHCRLINYIFYESAAIIIILGTFSMYVTETKELFTILRQVLNGDEHF